MLGSIVNFLSIPHVALAKAIGVSSTWGLIIVVAALVGVVYGVLAYFEKVPAFSPDFMKTQGQREREREANKALEAKLNTKQDLEATKILEARMAAAKEAADEKKSVNPNGEASSNLDDLGEE